VVNPVQTWKQLPWAFRSYKRLQILRFYCSNTGLYTGILHRRFAGAIYKTNFPGRILWRYCYRKFHLVALGIYTDFWTHRASQSLSLPSLIGIPGPLHRSLSAVGFLLRQQPGLSRVQRHSRTLYSRNLTHHRQNAINGYLKEISSNPSLAHLRTFAMTDTRRLSSPAPNLSASSIPASSPTKLYILVTPGHETGDEKSRATWRSLQP